MIPRLPYLILACFTLTAGLQAAIELPRGKWRQTEGDLSLRIQKGNTLIFSAASGPARYQLTLQLTATVRREFWGDVKKVERKAVEPTQPKQEQEAKPASTAADAPATPPADQVPAAPDRLDWLKGVQKIVVVYEKTEVQVLCFADDRLLRELSFTSKPAPATKR